MNYFVKYPLTNIVLMFWSSIAFLVCSYLKQVTANEHRIIEETLKQLTFPDAEKVNVGEDEYISKLEMYIQNLKDIGEIAPNLYFSERGKINNSKDRRIYSLEYSKVSVAADEHISHITLRVLYGLFLFESEATVSVYQVLHDQERAFVTRRNVYLSADYAKWVDFDLTNIIQNLENDMNKITIELHCDTCQFQVPEPKQSRMIYYSQNNRRVRRQLRTDCADTVGNQSRVLCCRTTKTFSFQDFNDTRLSSIIQPKSIEFGFCIGSCELRAHHGTNHSIVHTMMSKQNSTIPSSCCQPDVTKPLDVLVPFKNGTQLKIEKLYNLIVLECACY